MKISGKVTVKTGSHSYAIHIGHGLLDRAADLLPFDHAGRKAFILTDEAIDTTHARRLADGLKGRAQDVQILSLPGGEATKSFAALEKVTGWLLENGVNRKSVLFVAGGGVIGDLGGFAASIVMRGIPFVQIPTTLLAQVDSSVGGKTGINTKQGKNLIGTFNQPVAVLCDMDTIKTLPEREIKAGYAEILKYALLGDAKFFAWLEKNGAAVLAGEESALAHAIAVSCKAKAKVVGKDERDENDLRALLNLGHTFGHALEAAAGYDGRLLHGEGVSLGMVMAFRLSARMGLCPPDDVARVEAHIRILGLKFSLADIDPPLSQSADEITGYMKTDKKAEGGKNVFILVRGIGRAFVSRDVDMKDVREVIR